MKRIIFLICVISTIGCKDEYYYLTKDDFLGHEIMGSLHVYKMNLKIQAISTCPGDLIINLNNFRYKIKVNSQIDTVIREDWYEVPMKIVVEHDSCIIGIPRIGIRLID